jgi:hypothetical protein
MKKLDELYFKTEPKVSKPWDKPDFNVPTEIKPLDDEKPPTIN